MNHNANEKNIKAVGLLGAVGGIGDDLIAEAADDSTALHAGRTRTWSRLRVAVSAAATCLVLAVGIFAVTIFTGKNMDRGSDAWSPDNKYGGKNNGSMADIAGENAAGDVYDSTENLSVKYHYGVGNRIINDTGWIAFRGYDNTKRRTVSFTLHLDRSAPELRFVFASVEDNAATVGNLAATKGIVLTVNGKKVDRLPTEPGTYSIDIDYSEFDSECVAEGGLPRTWVYFYGFDSHELAFSLGKRKTYGSPELPDSMYTDEFRNIDLRDPKNQKIK